MNTVSLNTEQNSESLRKLAYIETISNLSPIPEADNLEVASILGWYAVVRKGEFKIGDKIVFIEVDAVLPNDNPAFSFMSSHNFRVRTLRLRGQISQGLVLPLRILPASFKEGDDVATALGIKKYVVPEPIDISAKSTVWPTHLPPKTDEIRIQNCYHQLIDYFDLPFFATEKLEGSSITCYLKGVEFGVCHRNYDLRDLANCNYWNTARAENIEEKLRRLKSKTGHDFAVQGELVGPLIQKNKLKLNQKEIYIFNIFDITEQKFLNLEELKTTANELNFKLVPLVHTDIYLKNYTLNQLVELSTMHSHINTSVQAEGLVFRPHKEIYVQRFGRLSFKIINPLFSLENDRERVKIK